MFLIKVTQKLLKFSFFCETLLNDETNTSILKLATNDIILTNRLAKHLFIGK